MISEIQIENFKSIASLTFEPGDVTVLIGENGSGKSNIIEAIAFAAAASVDKLDDEFLFNRGVRVTDQAAMLGKIAKPGIPKKEELKLAGSAAFHVIGVPGDNKLQMKVEYYWFSGPEGLSESSWRVWHTMKPMAIKEILESKEFHPFVDDLEFLRSIEPTIFAGEKGDQEFIMYFANHLAAKRASEISVEIGLRDFLIYAPENTALRNFETEGAIKPLGTKGEGLLKLLTRLAESDKGKFSKELNAHLQLLGWFGELHLPTENDQLRGRVRIRDRYLGDKGPVFDQRSANEGFLYLLFYFTLMLSRQTPAFFAIDNIDNALNPKLCSELIRHLAKLAKKMGKQMICTTHNPAILDGLNLKDDRQRLYVVRRDSKGHTVADRVHPPRPRPGGSSVKLSEAFMSGLLGGLPEHF